MEKKVVYVVDANIRKADIYRLTEGITYDVMGRTVWRGSESVRLAPQAATLFLQFLHAKEHSILPMISTVVCGTGTGARTVFMLPSSGCASC